MYKNLMLLMLMALVVGCDNTTPPADTEITETDTPAIEQSHGEPDIHWFDGTIAQAFAAAEALKVLAHPPAAKERDYLISGEGGGLIALQYYNPLRFSHWGHG